MKKKYLGLKQQFLLLSLCSGSLMASPCHAGPTIPGFIGNTADVLSPIPKITLPGERTIIQGIDSIRNLTPSQMEITQNAPKAVIHWKTFDIGSDSSVNFNQQGNATWAALNVIGDASHKGISQIHGRLTADGKVYLINQNGIFFGPNAQVNVHSLTASSLNLDENHFSQGYSTKNGAVSTFTFRNENSTPGGTVQNSGSISAADGGQVFLIGGKAVNSGSISAKQGFVAMAAGDTVSLEYNNSIQRYAFPNVQTHGDTAEVTNTSVNASPALLQADEGIVGLYGGIVNQNGRATATTAVSRNGQIELMGLSRVATGAGSVTETPVTASTERQTPPEDKIKRGLITVNAKEFNHQGAISSPGGTVTIGPLPKGSMDSIHLAAGSSIDVSGLWVDQSAEDRILQVQLNSDVLKDAYALKNGPLYGKTVRVDILNGMPTADISDYLDNRTLTAAEQLTEGGAITLTADRVEIASGSSVDISGGGYNYAAGELDLTMVRVGTRLYTLSDLPAGTPVDEVMGTFTRVHTRYGVKETWNGLYSGGSTSMVTRYSSFIQGSDAGTLTISTPYLFMAGALDGWAKRGFYQTEEEDKTYTNGNTMAIGRRMPMGGTLNIGSSDSSSDLFTIAESSASTHAIAVVSGMDSIPAESQSATAVSTISSSIINNAGLSSLGLHANTTFSLAEDASIQLAPGGSFDASARKVDISGEIRVQGGSISIASRSNKTSFDLNNGINTNDVYIPLEESLTIHSGAVLDASGEEINNFGQQEMTYGYTQGGTISLTNQSAPSIDNFRNPSHGYDLTMASGSRLSVQGGYWQDTSGKTTGADAGSLEISQIISESLFEQLLPDNLHLTIDGELLGHALLGNKGGSLIIGANEMTIFPAAGSPPPASTPSDTWDSIVFADNRFAGTGFSSITLNTYGDLTVTGGSRLEPSPLRRALPSSAYAGGQPIGLITESSSLVKAIPLEAGATRIALNAGTINHKPKLTLEEGSVISVTPNGKGAISLSTHGSADIGGTLEARAGSISITGQDITVGRTARILASGVNLEQPSDSRLRAGANWKILDGGTVTLSATNGGDGSLSLEPGSLIDVSGSPRISNTFADEPGNIFQRDVAGRPGSIFLDFVDDLSINGDLAAESYLFGLTGGTLSVKRSHGTEPLFVTEALIRSMKQPGFDDLRLASVSGINFTEPITLFSDRRLVLDAPQLISSDGSITLGAPWVEIVNTFKDNEVAEITAVEDGARSLTVQANFIDITGEIRTDGFSTVNLLADRAIRLSDRLYPSSSDRNSNNQPILWHGLFTLSGDLTLQANAIYPTTNSTYTITTNSGQVSILPNQETSPGTFYSAGGSLTIIAHDIYHAGSLYAPMGSITMTADEGRLLLAPGSLVSVSGAGNIPYGIITLGDWKFLNKYGKNGIAYEDMTTPRQSVSISGKEVMAAAGSHLEASGGGSLSAYQFLPGFDGTANPLDTKDRFVIIPDNSITLPEQGEMYLTGYAPLGLTEGVYSILPAEYAFLPGALVLEPGPTGIFPGQGSVNLLQQPIITGYERAYGSNEVPSTMNGYVIRTAADVMKEGNFDYRTLQIENGGNISISGNTLVMMGAVSAQGVGNGHDGEMTLAGTNINYGTVPAELRGLTSLADMDRLAAYADSAWLDTGMFSGGGALSKLTLGNAATNAVTFAAGQTLKGIPHVVINAGGSITISENAAIDALATTKQKGVLELHTDSLTTEAGSLLHASNELLLDIDSDWDFGGDWKVDDGRVHLASSLFSIGADSASDPGTGLFMTQAMLKAFAGVKELLIESETDIRFVDNISLVTNGSLLLDSQRLLFKGTDSTPDNLNVSISADNLRLKNSHAASTAAAPTATGGHNLQLNANNLTMGPGTVRVDGFTNVDLNTSGSLFFEGQGSLQAKLPEAGNLTMTANGFFATYPDDMETLSANRFSVDSGLGKVLLQNSGTATPTYVGTPGNLAIHGRSITMDAALLDFPGGRVELTATGTGAEDKVLLKNGTRILARGGLLRNSLDLNNPEDAVTFQLSGGEALFSAANGQVVFENTGSSKNIIDVSATNGQNGGRVNINGGASDLDLGALTLLGGGGDGGSFELVTRALPQLDALAAALTNGGFTNELILQAREEDMSLGAGSALAARSITLVADGENDPSGTEGQIIIAGTVTASSETGGNIAIYAEQDLTLTADGRIEAKGSTGSGGEVLLSSEQGMVKTDLHSMIDTTGQGADTGKNGSVTFRTGLTESQASGSTTYDVRLDAKGKVNSGETILQPVKTYTYAPGTSITGNEVGNLALTDLSTNNEGTWIGDSHRFIDGLASYKTAGYTLRPEIEVQSSGDLTLASGFQILGNNGGIANIQKDLANWRPGGLPGILTFRAGGSLNVETSITDVPTKPMLNDITGDIASNNNEIVRDINPDGLIDSWALSFVAGADLTASNPLFADADEDLTIGTGNGNTVTIYSESGDINLSAGQDIMVKSLKGNPNFYRNLSYMPGVKTFTVGTFDGDIHVRAGRDLDLSDTYKFGKDTYGGILQNGIGDISIETGGNILLGDYGSIRTSGRMPTWNESETNYQTYHDAALTTYNKSKKTSSDKGVFNAAVYNRSQLFWLYRDGGDISIQAGGNVAGAMKIGLTAAGWDQKYLDFGTKDPKYKDTTYRWSANYDSNSSVSAIVALGGGSIDVVNGGSFLAQAGAFGQNNVAALNIHAKGDLDGQFLAMRGNSLLSTLGSFGTTTVNATESTAGVGIGDVHLTIQAMGNTEAVTVYNPTLANRFNSFTSSKNPIPSFLSYGAGSMADISAFFGSAIFTGTDNNYTKFADLTLYKVLPGSLSIRAARDILFTNSFTLAPAPEGSLELLAGQDIQGRYDNSNPGQLDYSSSLLMSDAPMTLYNDNTRKPSDLINKLTLQHSDPPLHGADRTPVHIEAGRDISKVDFTLPKMSEIIAARDLLNIRYIGQHLRADNQSILSAGRDFLQPEVIGQYKPSPSNPNVYHGITQAGPGSLLIQAGNNLDLADSSGIRSIGSSANTAAQDTTIALDANGRIKGSDITVIVGYDTRPFLSETAGFLTKLKSAIRDVSALIAEGKDSEAAILKEKIRAELFTPFLFDHLSGTGDLNMITSSLHTISGQDAINIFAAGDVNVGVTRIESTDPILNAKDTGIFTAGGGPINLLAGKDINVNESRVMTFLGGDIIVLSDEGDINAGRGSKAKVTAAEPQIVEKDGVKSVIFSPPAVGSGLRTLAYDPDGNGPRVTPEPGDMYVVAWDGVVDAGEAGIEGGRLYLAANKVLNSQNISVGAGSVGVPSSSAAPVSLGALSGDSMSATESTSSDIAKSTAGAGDKMAETARKIADTISQLRFFVVKFLGFIE